MFATTSLKQGPDSSFKVHEDANNGAKRIQINYNYGLWPMAQTGKDDLYWRWSVSFYEEVESLGVMHIST